MVEALPTYLDGNGLARYFPGDLPGSPSLTAYLLDVSQAAGFAIPPDIAGRMEKGLLAFAEGRIKPEHWAPTNDLTARKLSALEALTRRGHKPLGVITSLDLEQPMRLPTAALMERLGFWSPGASPNCPTAPRVWPPPSRKSAIA